MLTVCTFLWGWKYDRAYVAKLAAGVRRNLKQPYRFLAVTDRDVDIDGVLNYAIPEQDRYLLDVPGCFARLRLFDPVWQKLTQCHDRIVSIDLDAVITGSLDELFDRDESFTILQNINTTNPCPFNGSVWMLRAGYRPDVWADFSIDAAGKVPFHAFPDDQGWLHHKMPDAGAWGPEAGVYGFKKRGWHWPSASASRDDGALPPNAKIVAFPGWRDPSKFEELPWVKQNWRA